MFHLNITLVCIRLNTVFNFNHLQAVLEHLKRSLYLNVTYCMAQCRSLGFGLMPILPSVSCVRYAASSIAASFLFGHFRRLPDQLAVKAKLHPTHAGVCGLRVFGDDRCHLIYTQVEKRATRRFSACLRCHIMGGADRIRLSHR